MLTDVRTELEAKRAELATLTAAREAPARAVQAAENELYSATLALGELKGRIEQAARELADAKKEQADVAARAPSLDHKDDAALHEFARQSDVARARVEVLGHRFTAVRAPLPALENAQADARQKLRRVETDFEDATRRQKEAEFAQFLRRVDTEARARLADILQHIGKANHLDHDFDKARGAAFTPTSRGSIWPNVEPGHFWDGLGKGLEHHDSLERRWTEIGEHERLAAARRNWEEARPRAGYQATGPDGAADYAGGATAPEGN